MTDGQKQITCTAVALAVAALIMYVVSGSARANAADQSGVSGGIADSALGGWHDMPGDHLDDGKGGVQWWHCQPWQMRHAGQEALSERHALHRRPAYPGCNRHTVMVSGWPGWFSSPPSEVTL